jgi:hypothetical protein
VWFNLRASNADSTIYWQLSSATIDGPTRMNIEVPDAMVNDQAAIDRLVVSFNQVELCPVCDGATVALGQPWGCVGYHTPECQAYYGWTVRDAPLIPRPLTAEPTP